MTYQQQYERLHKAYEAAINSLNDAAQKIAYTNGFGELNDLSNYHTAHRNFRSTEREFQNLLNYVNTGALNPQSEYIHQEYMYAFIKKDQQEKGFTWKNEDLIPADVKGYECSIGLTNDGELATGIQGTEYKFPVLNIHHGKECFSHLAKMLQRGGGEDFDIDQIKTDNINERNQVFIRILIIIWN